MGGRLGYNRRLAAQEAPDRGILRSAQNHAIQSPPPLLDTTKLLWQTFKEADRRRVPSYPVNTPTDHPQTIPIYCPRSS